MSEVADEYDVDYDQEEDNFGTEEFGDVEQAELAYDADDEYEYSDDEDEYEDEEDASYTDSLEPSNWSLASAKKNLDRFKAVTKLSDNSLSFCLFEEAIKMTPYGVENVVFKDDQAYFDFLCSIKPDLKALANLKPSESTIPEMALHAFGCVLVSATYVQFCKLINDPKKAAKFADLLEAGKMFVVFQNDKALPGVEIADQATDLLNPILENNLNILDVMKSASAVEKVEAPVAKNDLLVSMEDEITTAVSRVMNIYTDLFSSCFELTKPFGIITKTGVYLLNNDVVEVKSHMSFSKIYEMFNALTNNAIVQSSSMSSDTFEMRDGTTYYPAFQLSNMWGVLGAGSRAKSWEEFKPALAKRTRAIVELNIVNGKSLKDIINSLTMCILVSEFNVDSHVSLKVSCGLSKLTDKAVKVGYASVQDDIFTGIGELHHALVSSNGVLDLTIVLSQDAYNNRPLFAYEVIESQKSRNIVPSIKQFVLGRGVNGKTVELNLDRQTTAITLIGAGQRSGKGVLTLNMLGTILGSNNPLIYLDGKPDMANALWDLSEKHGVPCAVYDGFATNGRKFTNVPAGIFEENGELLSLLAYLKVLQLMMAASILHADGKLSTKDANGKSFRPFFIFDEALAIQQSLASCWGSVYGKAKNKKDESVEALWTRTVVSWSEGIGSKLSAVINSQLPKSGISTVWLFQAMQPTEWSKFDLGGLNTAKFSIFKHAIMSRSSVKILGKGTADSSYGLSDVRTNDIISKSVLSEGGRHFAMATSQKINSILDLTVFKPYLVLNSADADSSYVKELQNNVSSKVWDVIAKNGEVDPRIGLEGYMTYIGESAVQNLALGKNYLNMVLSQLNVNGKKYADVDEYIYDMSPDSFVSTGRLTNSGSQEEGDIPDSSAPVFSITASAEGAGVGSINGVQGNFVSGAPNVRTPEQRAVAYSQSKFNHSDFSGLEAESPVGSGANAYSLNANPPSGVPVADSVQVGGFNGQGGGSDVQAGGFNGQGGGFNQQQDGLGNQPDSLNAKTGYSNVYSGEMSFGENPFKVFGASESPFACINALNMSSTLVKRELIKVFGSLSRINSFEIKGNGLLVVNGIAFKPAISPDVIETMPYDIQGRVAQGCLADLLQLKLIYEMSNLIFLSIDDQMFAESRGRRELGIAPKTSWSVITKRLRSLQEFYIGGQNMLNPETAKNYASTGNGGAGFMSLLRDKWSGAAEKYDPETSPTNKMMQKPAVKAVTRSLGLVAGTQLLTTAAVMFGPMGMLFGAFVLGNGAWEMRKAYKKGNL